MMSRAAAPVFAAARGLLHERSFLGVASASGTFFRASVCEQQQKQHACEQQRLLSVTGPCHGVNKGDSTPPVDPIPSTPPARLKRQGRALPPSLPKQQWVEVVDKASGHVYYWNQTTGAYLAQLEAAARISHCTARWPAMSPCGIVEQQQRLLGRLHVSPRTQG